MQQDDSYGDPGGLVAWLSLFDPMMRAMALMTKSLSLRHALLKCGTGFESRQEPTEPLSQTHSQNFLDENVLSVLGSCFEALEDFDSWDLDAESYWKHTFEERSVPAALGEVATKAKYYDPKTACTIILVRSARLVLLLGILEYYGRTQVAKNYKIEPGDEDSGARVASVLLLEVSTRSTIDDMLSSVPFAMGDVDTNGNAISMAYDGAAALIILQPMRLVTYCPYATNEQRSHVQSILDRLNSTIGVRSAVSWEAQGLSVAHGGSGELGINGTMTGVDLSLRIVE